MKNNTLTGLSARLNNRWFRFSKRGALQAGGNLLTYITLLAFSVIFLAPFFYMIGRSVMSAYDLSDFNVVWLPRSFETANYVNAWKLLDYPARLARSLLVAGAAVLGQILTCSLVGYGIARIKFRGSALVFALVVFGMIIPPQTVITTQFELYVALKAERTVLPLILPSFLSFGINGGLFVFLFRQFFKGMPPELENAAMIDGTGVFGAYFRIMLPNASSAVLVTLILSFIWQWNNYFEPSIYLDRVELYTLVQMLPIMGKDFAGFNDGIRMAGTFLCALPPLLIFFVLQRRFIRGIETTGLAN